MKVKSTRRFQKTEPPVTKEVERVGPATVHETRESAEASNEIIAKAMDEFLNVVNEQGAQAMVQSVIQYSREDDNGTNAFATVSGTVDHPEEAAKLLAVGLDYVTNIETSPFNPPPAIRYMLAKFISALDDMTEGAVSLLEAEALTQETIH